MLFRSPRPPKLVHVCKYNGTHIASLLEDVPLVARSNVDNTIRRQFDACSVKPEVSMMRSIYA